MTQLRQNSYRSFRNDAGRALAERHVRREQRKRRINMLAAALLLASAGFWATMLTTPPTSQATLTSPQAATCLGTGESLEPWFKAELHRRASAAVARRDDFDVMLAWFQDARRKCAAGLTEPALKDFQAIADRIYANDRRRQSAGD